MSSIDIMTKSERPRERLRRKGAHALGDGELLAILLGAGNKNEDVMTIAHRLLTQMRGLEKIPQCGFGVLQDFAGIGTAKATRILAAVEIGVRIVERRRANGNGPTRFTCSSDIFQAYQARLGALTQEVFFVVGLNVKNEIVTEVVVAKGSVSECHVSPREVFRPLIVEACAKMIALHNHPSGDPNPSPSDVALTQRLVKVGELIDIPMLDHLVIGQTGYVSFRDTGIIPAK